MTLLPGTPLPSEEAKAWLEAAIRAFRAPQAVRDNVPTACLLNGASVIGELPTKLRRTREVLVLFEDDGTAFRATPDQLQQYLSSREPWEDYNILVVPSDLAWCLGISHDDVLRWVPQGGALGR